MLVSVASLAGQGNDKTLRGTVTIKTNGYTVAVHGKAGQPDTEFLFCIDQDRSAPAQRIEFTGPARVMYRAVPIAGIPAGVVISGPESVANTLAVVGEDGNAWTFVAKDQKPLLAGGNRAGESDDRGDERGPQARLGDGERPASRHRHLRLSAAGRLSIRS